MAFYYVKAGGTAGSSDTGRFASQQTGTWSGTTSEYWLSVRDLLTNATTKPTDGDYICVSDTTAITGASGTPTINNGTDYKGAGVIVISVDNSNREIYKPGASEDGTGYLQLAYNGTWAGVDFTGSTTGFYSPGAKVPQVWNIQDCKVKSTSTEVLRPESVQCVYNLRNVDLDIAAATLDIFRLQAAATVNWNGGSVISSGTCTLFDTSFGTSGAFFTAIGVDLSAVDTFWSITSGSTKNYLVKLFNCTLPTTLTYTAPDTIRQRIEIYSSDDTSSVQHRFLVEDGAGKVINNETTYITADPSMNESSTPVSMEVTTKALCSHVHPFKFTIPAQYVDLGNAASDKLTIEITTDQALTVDDIAAWLVYPDGTTLEQPNWVISGGNISPDYGNDPFTGVGGTPAALTTSALGAGDWTAEPVAPNFYVLELDTSVDVGEGAGCEIQIEVYIPSIAAGELFISPIFTTS